MEMKPTIRVGKKIWKMRERDKTRRNRHKERKCKKDGRNETRGKETIKVTKTNLFIVKHSVLLHSLVLHFSLHSYATTIKLDLMHVSFFIRSYLILRRKTVVDDSWKLLMAYTEHKYRALKVIECYLKAKKRRRRRRNNAATWNKQQLNGKSTIFLLFVKSIMIIVIRLLISFRFTFFSHNLCVLLLFCVHWFLVSLQSWSIFLFYSLIRFNEWFSFISIGYAICLKILKASALVQIAGIILFFVILTIVTEESLNEKPFFSILRLTHVENVIRPTHELVWYPWLWWFHFTWFIRRFRG